MNRKKIFVSYHNVPKQVNVAFTADDLKKEDVVSLIRAHKQELAQINLVATENTGNMIQSKADLPVTLLNSGLQGGYQQIGALAADGQITAIIFLRDPATARPLEPDITALMQICDVHNVPIATNPATGEAVLHLVFEHPEAIAGHHIIAQYLEDIAAVHEP